MGKPFRGKKRISLKKRAALMRNMNAARKAKAVLRAQVSDGNILQNNILQLKTEIDYDLDDNRASFSSTGTSVRIAEVRSLKQAESSSETVKNPNLNVIKNETPVTHTNANGNSQIPNTAEWSQRNTSVEAHSSSCNLDDLILEDVSISQSVDWDSFFCSKFVVYGECVLDLFKKCLQSRCPESVCRDDLQLSTSGSSLEVRWKCTAGHVGTWTTQPMIGTDRKGDVELSTAIALANYSHLGMAKLFRSLRMQFHDKTRHEKIINKYVLPSVATRGDQRSSSAPHVDTEEHNYMGDASMRHPPMLTPFTSFLPTFQPTGRRAGLESLGGISVARDATNLHNAQPARRGHTNLESLVVSNVMTVSSSRSSSSMQILKKTKRKRPKIPAEDATCNGTPIVLHSSSQSSVNAMPTLDLNSQPHPSNNAVVSTDSLNHPVLFNVSPVIDATTSFRQRQNPPLNMPNVMLNNFPVNLNLNRNLTYQTAGQQNKEIIGLLVAGNLAFEVYAEKRPESSQNN